MTQRQSSKLGMTDSDIQTAAPQEQATIKMTPRNTLQSFVLSDDHTSATGRYLEL